MTKNKNWKFLFEDCKEFSIIAQVHPEGKEIEIKFSAHGKNIFDITQTVFLSLASYLSSLTMEERLGKLKVEVDIPNNIFLREVNGNVVKHFTNVELNDNKVAGLREFLVRNVFTVMANVDFVLDGLPMVLSYDNDNTSSDIEPWGELDIWELEENMKKSKASRKNAAHSIIPLAGIAQDSISGYMFNLGHWGGALRELLEEEYNMLDLSDSEKLWLIEFAEQAAFAFDTETEGRRQIRTIIDTVKDIATTTQDHFSYLASPVEPSGFSALRKINLGWATP